MNSLFQTDRTTRQKYCIKSWIKSGGKASIEAATGFGTVKAGMG